MNFKLFNKERDKKILKWVVIGIVIVAALITVKDEFLYQIGYYDSENPAIEQLESLPCNTTIIKLHGDLYIDVLPSEDGTSSFEVSSTAIASAIEKADEDSNIKAIILDINSFGGSAVAGEEVSNALKHAGKPTTALIRESGLSAAYLAATGADTIFTSKYSDVGSIGVTMSYLDNVQKNQIEGLTYNQLSTGKFKDTLDPNKPLTYEEKQVLMEYLKRDHDNFVKDVAENRGLDIEKVRVLADGFSISGSVATESGLIDHIGGLYEVRGYLAAELGEPAVICGE